VPEVAAAREHHRAAGDTNCLDDLGVPLGSAGLDDPCHARSEGSLRTIGEREERIGSKHGAAHVVTVLPRFL
jgi:hypothetical protein